MVPLKLTLRKQPRRVLVGWPVAWAMAGGGVRMVWRTMGARPAVLIRAVDARLATSCEIFMICTVEKLLGFMFESGVAFLFLKVLGGWKGFLPNCPGNG